MVRAGPVHDVRSYRVSVARRAIDLTGQRFGEVEVSRRHGTRNESATWVCVCKNGHESIRDTHTLKRHQPRCSECNGVRPPKKIARPRDGSIEFEGRLLTSAQIGELVGASSRTVRKRRAAGMPLRKAEPTHEAAGSPDPRRAEVESEQDECVTEARDHTQVKRRTRRLTLFQREFDLFGVAVNFRDLCEIDGGSIAGLERRLSRGPAKDAIGRVRVRAGIARRERLRGRRRVEA